MLRHSFGNPVKKESPCEKGAYSTTWNCVLFGEYPMREIVRNGFDSVSPEAFSEDDIVTDENLYSQLENAEWKDGKTVCSGQKYYRIFADDATTATSNGLHHYRWKDKSAPHYFLFEPIKWRILRRRDGILTLLADRALDCRKFNDTPGKTDWESCSLRSWLNSEFISVAFCEAARESIVLTKTQNNPNSFYQTCSGPDTLDRVSIPSNDEVFNTDISSAYGFCSVLGMDDAAKRFGSTMFAKCRGSWWSPTDHFSGNAFWFMRTGGRIPSSVTYICDMGYVYAFGTESVCDDAGILPLIHVYENSSFLTEAGTVTVHNHSEPTEKRSVIANGGISSEEMKTEREYCMFGAYPDTEIIASPCFNAVESYAVKEGDYEINPDLFERLEAQEWKNDEAIIDGVRYCRRFAAANNEAQHYMRFADGYHYFRFEPIRWRVLRRENGKKYLLSVRSLDCRIFNSSTRHASWQTSSLREWLNNEFFTTAFSESEQKQICAIKTDNKNNIFFKVASGNETVDRVVIPSEDDVFFTSKSLSNGFMRFSYLPDEARQIGSTMYSKYMGTWYSPAEGGKGNCFWFLRTSGYNTSNIVYVSEFGDILNRGCYTSVQDAGIIPEICVADSNPQE